MVHLQVVLQFSVLSAIEQAYMGNVHACTGSIHPHKLGHGACLCTALIIVNLSSLQNSLKATVLHKLADHTEGKCMQSYRIVGPNSDNASSEHSTSLE